MRLSVSFGALVGSGHDCTTETCDSLLQPRCADPLATESPRPRSSQERSTHPRLTGRAGVLSGACLLMLAFLLDAATRPHQARSRPTTTGVAPLQASTAGPLRAAAPTAFTSPATTMRSLPSASVRGHPCPLTQAPPHRSSVARRLALLSRLSQSESPNAEASAIRQQTGTLDRRSSAVHPWRCSRPCPLTTASIR